MPGFIYIDSEQMQTELKKLLLDEKTTQRVIAERLGLSPQGFQKLINKHNFSFDDANRILSALDYELLVRFQKKEAVKE